MLCEACGKNPATVHITENPSDKENRKEIHLCEDCARENGQVQEPSLSQICLVQGPAGFWFDCLSVVLCHD